MPAEPAAEGMAILEDPLVMHALGRHGLTASTVEWRHTLEGLEITLAQRGDAPRMSINEDGFGVLSWPVEPGSGRSAVMYETSRVTRQVGVMDTHLPEAMIATLVGRPLRDLIEMPGDPGFVMAEIRNETIMDMPELVIRLQPLETEEREDVPWT